MIAWLLLDSVVEGLLNSSFIIHCLIIAWLIDCSIDRLSIDCLLIAWNIVWLIDWMLDWLLVCFICFLIASWLLDWLISASLTVYCLLDWVFDWLLDCLTDFLLSVWLIDDWRVTFFPLQIRSVIGPEPPPSPPPIRSRNFWKKNKNCKPRPLDVLQNYIWQYRFGHFRRLRRQIEFLITLQSSPGQSRIARVGPRTVQYSIAHDHLWCRSEICSAPAAPYRICPPSAWSCHAWIAQCCQSCFLDCLLIVFKLAYPMFFLIVWKLAGWNAQVWSIFLFV